MPEVSKARAWPAEGLARVPYWVYREQDLYARELERIYGGPTWCFLGLEAELAEPGDSKTTFAGEMPVVVARDLQGAVRCFESRSAHRSALFCLKMRERGKGMGETALFASGHYLDRVRIDGEEALFEERIAVLDSRSVDTPLSIPL